MVINEASVIDRIIELFCVLNTKAISDNFFRQRYLNRTFSDVQLYYLREIILYVITWEHSHVMTQDFTSLRYARRDRR